MEVPGLARPLRGDGGTPLNEIVLLDGERPTVVFRTHHGVMDGQGLLIWAGGVFRALRGEVVEPALDTVTDTALMRRVGRTEGVTPLKAKVRPVLRAKRSFRQRGAVVRRRTLAGTYPALTARLAAALNTALDLPAGAFYIPVDMRRHDPALRATGNLSVGFGIKLEPGSTWREAHAADPRLAGEERRDLRLPQPCGGRTPGRRSAGGAAPRDEPRRQRAGPAAQHRLARSRSATSAGSIRRISAASPSPPRRSSLFPAGGT